MASNLLDENRQISTIQNAKIMTTFWCPQHFEWHHGGEEGRGVTKTGLDENKQTRQSDVIMLRVNSIGIDRNLYTCTLGFKLLFCGYKGRAWHYSDVIMGSMTFQITSLTIVYSTVYSGADRRKHQSSASLAFVWGIHRGPVNSPHKWPVTWKMFPFDDVIMVCWKTLPLVRYHKRASQYIFLLE